MLSFTFISRCSPDSKRLGNTGLANGYRRFETNFDGGTYRLQNSYVHCKFYLLQVLKSALSSKKKNAIITMVVYYLSSNLAYFIDEKGFLILSTLIWLRHRILVKIHRWMNVNGKLDKWTPKFYLWPKMERWWDAVLRRPSPSGEPWTQLPATEKKNF